MNTKQPKNTRKVGDGSGMTGLGYDWMQHWKDLPEFSQRELRPLKDLVVQFKNVQDRQAFAELLGRPISDATKSVWWPDQGRMDALSLQWFTEKPVIPKYPVYVISKGRWNSRMTSRALERMQVPYHIVVEPQEYDNYAAVIDPKKILTLPFSNLGQGSIPARNWVWEHSISLGASWHWILDDNISAFFRMYKNVQRRVQTGAVFRIVEDFVNRYENIGQGGLNYKMFFPRKSIIPPLYVNTRVYSCMLNRNDLPFRWRGKYNEDTDLSLRILKAGWCTVLFNAFLCNKMPTLTMKGGNTDELYKQDGQFDGRYEMAKSLFDQHPDVVEISQKWGRWQHSVDYTRVGLNEFRRLKFKKTALIPEGINNYGMFLMPVDESKEPLLLVGQYPSKKEDPNAVLCGDIGRRIAALGGITDEWYLENTDRMNVFPEYPGKQGKGDAWDAKAAAERALEMELDLQGRRVLFVGKNVAAAFGYDDLPWLEWKKLDDGGMVAVIPHLSKIVLWWNDVENRKAAGKFLKEIFAKGAQDVGTVEEEE